ncbi:MAG TPA: hypothetical protein VGQ76_14580, partial [Thermoanaerobaculia bacterium]|nr:hypothetical protein [Thermoanaerobaculia bacterium]
MSLRRLIPFVIALAMTGAMQAGEVARGDLAIIGLGLEVDRNPVQAATGVPSFVQTKFGGVMNDEAPVAPGLSALGELIGPGIDTPLTLSAIPGKKFALPALHEKGEYTLQNIRLVGANGEFLQPAVPSFALITVSDALSTKVRVRQLRPEELRERGITIDARNFEVYGVIRNESTYGVLSLFGYGIGVYDLNAVESNDAPEKPVDYETLREQIRITRARTECGPFEPEAIPDLTFSPDATIVTRTGSTALHILAVDLHRGVLDLAIEHGIDHSSTAPSCGERAPIGLLLRDHPRIVKLRERFIEHENREPFGRFTGAARYRWTLEPKDNVGQRGSAIKTPVQRDYMLIPGNEYGLLVVEIAGNPPTLVPSYQPLQPIHLVDVIWIPGGAYAVRTIAGSNLATVIDGEGHALLVDLSQLDERWDGDELIEDDALFATASKVLQDNVHTPDPRIVWRSANPLATGTVAPVVDPNTGFLYVGKTLQKTTSVVAALDPKLTFRSVKGNVAMTGIVPHGIAPPAGFTTDSLGSFRVETTLPGGISQSIESGALILAVDSERVFGAKTEDTPDGWPHAHLTDLALRRVLPVTIPGLRHQSGYNRWISHPVVAIGDPRASKFYIWAPDANKAAEGCYACDPPAVANAQEIYSLGRAFRVRAGNAFQGSGYAYLAENGRFEARIATIPADTIRPPAMRVAAQQPATAGGMLQDTTHLHSGEVETAAIDFDFGGRAGWNVTLDRSYRSRTIGLAPLGPGWDSAIFKRLRVLPDGVVEYRDGAEIWPFRLQGGQYVAPLGLFLRLTKTATGWSLIDQKWRITTFDQYGRLASESDEFYSPDKPDSGNTIHYLYDANGRLGTIVDPVGRLTTLNWNAQTGSLFEVSDWRSPKRTITYRHDPAQRRLMKVELPNVANTSGQRPLIDFGYQEASAQFNDRLEITTNLTTVRNPTEASSNGNPRVTFTYELDRVTRQQWATGERATFSYPSPTTAIVTDVLGQERRYSFNANDPDLLGDRAHATTVREIDVPVWGGAVVPGIPQATNTDRVETFSFSAGVLDSAKLEGVRETTITHVPPVGAPGSIVKSVTTAPLVTGDDTPITRVLEYQAGANGSTFLQAIEAGGKRIASPEPHRNNIEPIAINQSDSLTGQQKFDAQGRVKKVTSTGGTDTAGAGSEGNIDYWPDSAVLHKRGLPKVIRSGALETKLEYPSETQTVATDPRGVITTTTFDEWGRTKKINVMKPGDPLSLTEQYTWDASGRVHDVVRTRNGGDVTTRYQYDAMGRTTKQETDQIATIVSLSTTTEYHLDSRSIITRQSSGASTTTKLDPLGRIIHSRTETGSSPIEERFGYDLAGNRVFATDMLTATAETYDVHGRVVKSRFADGTSQSAEYDEWDRPKITKRLADNGASVGESSYTFTDTGRLRSLVSKVDTGVSRTTDFAWDGGGRTTHVATNGRASETKFDIAGRLLKHAAGAGSLTSLTDTFSTTNVSSHDGALPSKTTTAEKFSGSYTATAKHNTAGDVTEESVGSLSWKQTFDQLGSVTSASVPGRKATTWSVDARGAVKEEKLPDGATNQFEYGASGAQSRYRDPENEPTQTSSDQIGRPLRRTFADGTAEVITWQGARLQSVTDRQGRKQSYVYNSKGQLSEIRDAGTELTDKLTYDNAGRLISWKNADSEVAWSDFNLQDAPKKTTQRRFRDGSGLTALVVL